MRVIVCGAGRVGYGIARRLSREGNDVIVIDQSKELVREIGERLDVRPVLGNCCYPDVLAEAGARDADMIIAVTLSDEVNMITSQIGHTLFGIPTKIARIRAQGYLDPKYSDLFSRNHLPIDVIISPELAVSEAIMQRMITPGAFDVASFVDGKVWAVGVKLNEDCPVVDTPLDQLYDLFPDLKVTIVAIRREGKIWRAHGSDQLDAGDQIFLVGKREQIPRALDILGTAVSRARRIIIIGGGNIGLNVARGLEGLGSMKIRLIEQDRKRAEYIAERLERTIVLQGDGLDRTLLREAGVSDADTVIALTNNDQVNILASVVAKKEGARRALTLVNEEDYSAVGDAVGIDRTIDPRSTTVSSILQHIRKGRIKGLYSLFDGSAEIIDAVALETSPLVGKPLSEAGLPDGVIVGAIYRDGAVIINQPDFVVQAGDRIVLMALREHVRAVEQMFRVSVEYF
ncbi:MAG: Trk system potassium transporter TrkA [Pseudomonadota bacterium]